MTLDPKALEAAARAATAQLAMKPDDWQSELPTAQSAITAYLAAMREQGFAMMPREPTEAMRNASTPSDGGVSGPYGDDRYYLSDAQLNHIWRAMFDAAAGDA